jgi:hypothetical protein
MVVGHCLGVFFQMDAQLWELAIHLYFNILFLGIWLPKPPLMLEGIWEFLPHDRKDFLPVDEFIVPR